MIGFEGIGRLLIIFGAVVILIGLAMVFARQIPYIGRLPGDIFIRRDNIAVFIPIVTMIIVSIVLTLLLNLLPRFFR